MDRVAPRLRGIPECRAHRRLPRWGPVAASQSAPAPSSARRTRLPARRGEDGLLTGVAAGIAAHAGVDAFLVRWGFVLLGLAGGAGVALYLLAWGLMPAPPATASPGSSARPARPVTDERRLAFALSLVGALLLLRELGLWPGDLLMWPLMLGALGSGVIWATADEAERSRWGRMGLPGAVLTSRGAASAARLGAGALLVVLGMGVFLATNGIFAALRVAGLATTVTLLGAVLILGPYLGRLAKDLREEHVARIRSQERAEVAAHLHDSVLHTLALIQRAGSAVEMVTLARVQERELRAWLYGREEQGPGRLPGAVDELASRVERLHGVPVDAVVVGDAPMDEALRALVAAAQEAAVNAARHSGAPRVSVYVEAEEDRVTAWVRDEGTGFDPAAVPADRRGIADSIIGRLQRHDGASAITSDAGEGTEVQLWVPRKGGT